MECLVNKVNCIHPAGVPSLSATLAALLLVVSSILSAHASCSDPPFKDVSREHQERGQFEKQDGQWFFTEGIMVKQMPFAVSKLGRNDPCHCGSGLKYKKCCGK
jgi:hypothetical protein